LYYEVTGKGFPLVWIHEWGGSFRSWDSQVKFFSRRYQVITYNARGYPPSDVPGEPAAYSQEHAVDDLYQLLLQLGIKQAYVGGLSMGGTTALNFGIAHPDMARALIVASAGSGTTNREQFERETGRLAQQLETEGVEAAAELFTRGPTRVQLQRKDPRSWQAFYDDFLLHSAVGLALTMKGVVLKRQTIYALQSELRRLGMPTLVMVGDEDDACIEPAIFMKRNIPKSGLIVFPQSGHLINLEEPDLFNRAVLDFLISVATETWVSRDLQQVGGSLFFPAGASPDMPESPREAP
jgi:pimeloyl-ACP methyl ester carboxylesterase